MILIVGKGNLEVRVNKMDEIFKPIHGQESSYAISNYGNILSYGGTNGKIKNNRILKKRLDKDGYERSVIRVNKKQKL